MLIIFSVEFCSAFTLLNANQRGWDKKVLVFNLNPANCSSDTRFNIVEAMALWNSVNGSELKLELGATDSVATAAQAIAGAFSEEAVIVCDSSFAATTGTNPNVTAAVSNILINSNIQIAKGFLILNAVASAAASLSLNSQLRTQIIVAHEIGHMIGLGHSSDISALMYYSSATRNNFSLSQDDVDGFLYLYPRDETNKAVFMGGCGSLKNAEPPPTKMIFTLLALCLLPLAMTIKFRFRNQ